LTSSTIHRENAKIFGQSFGDADLVVFREDDSGLLLAVSQRNVVKLDLLGEFKTAVHSRIEIPRAYEPLVCLPWLI
jgi:hypothetical protein